MSELYIITNSLLLLFTIAYGLAFGIKNWTMTIRYTFSGNLRQSSLGKFLDYMLLIVVVYFFTYGKPFINLTIANIP